MWLESMLSLMYRHCILTVHALTKLAFVGYRYPMKSYLKLPVAVLTYHSLNGTAPSYQSSYYTRVADVSVDRG